MIRQIRIIKAKDIIPDTVSIAPEKPLTQIQTMQKWLSEARATIQERRERESRSFYTQTA